MLHEICPQSTNMMEMAFPGALATLGLALGVNPELSLPLGRKETELDTKGKTQIPAGGGSLEKRWFLLPCAL